MNDLAAYATLFVSAFTSATVLPGSSEAVLLALLGSGRGEVTTLVATAAAGNLIGSLLNWILGRFFTRFSDRRWFPVSPKKLERAQEWFGRYGIWTLLLAWVPVVGDPLTVIAGVMRVDLLRFVILVGLGKTARYIAVAASFLWFTG